MNSCDRFIFAVDPDEGVNPCVSLTPFSTEWTLSSAFWHRGPSASWQVWVLAGFRTNNWPNFHEVFSWTEQIWEPVELKAPEASCLWTCPALLISSDLGKPRGSPGNWAEIICWSCCRHNLILKMSSASNIQTWFKTSRKTSTRVQRPVLSLPLKDVWVLPIERKGQRRFWPKPVSACLPLIWNDFLGGQPPKSL